MMAAGLIEPALATDVRHQEQEDFLEALQASRGCETRAAVFGLISHHILQVRCFRVAVLFASLLSLFLWLLTRILLAGS